MWGLDAPLRMPLAKEVQAPTVVFAEHVVLVLLLAPLLPRAWRAFAAADNRARLAIIAIGAGSSAIATTLFTLAFRSGDPITPAVIQKLQPIIVIVAAAALLGERIRPRFAFFAIPALIGVWLLAFADPFKITVDRASVALLALGAAVLWAAGTVLGRFVSASIGPWEMTALRFSVGLPTAALMVALTGAPFWVPDLPSTGSIIGIALVPGLLAMVLYYRGLQRTAASRATLAELAYPLTATFIGILIFDRTMVLSQWMGALLIVIAVTALTLHESRSAVQAVHAPEIPTGKPTPAPTA